MPDGRALMLERGPGWRGLRIRELRPLE